MTDAAGRTTLRRIASRRVPMTRAARLVVVLALNLALVTALLVVGIAAHSLALLAAGGDYLLDAAAVGVALFALWLSARARRSPGARPYPDAGAWAALVNAGWLLLLELLVVAGAIDRLVTGVPSRARAAGTDPERCGCHRDDSERARPRRRPRR